MLQLYVRKFIQGTPFETKKFIVVVFHVSQYGFIMLPRWREFITRAINIKSFHKFILSTHKSKIIQISSYNTTNLTIKIGASYKQALARAYPIMHNAPAI
jgi:hypothetical protein